jgi:hypothetical protein
MHGMRAFGYCKHQAGAKQQHLYHILYAALCAVHARALQNIVTVSAI